MVDLRGLGGGRHFISIINFFRQHVLPGDGEANCCYMARLSWHGMREFFVELQKLFRSAHSKLKKVVRYMFVSNSSIPPPLLKKARSTTGEQCHRQASAVHPTGLMGCSSRIFKDGGWAPTFWWLILLCQSQTTPKYSLFQSTILDLNRLHVLTTCSHRSRFALSNLYVRHLKRLRNTTDIYPMFVSLPVLFSWKTLWSCFDACHHPHSIALVQPHWLYKAENIFPTKHSI